MGNKIVTFRFCVHVSLLSSLDHVSQNGWSSLMLASMNGHVEIVNMLLQHGATVDLQKLVCKYIHHKFHYPVSCVCLFRYPCVSSQNGASSLILASQNGHMEVVDKLLQQGARVDLKDQVITTPTCVYQVMRLFSVITAHIIIHKLMRDNNTQSAAMSIKKNYHKKYSFVKFIFGLWSPFFLELCVS